MKCPHCQGHIVDNASKMKADRRKRHLCVDCKAPCDEINQATGKPFARCFGCRVHQATINSRWRHQTGRRGKRMELHGRMKPGVYLSTQPSAQ